MQSLIVFRALLSEWRCAWILGLLMLGASGATSAQAVTHVRSQAQTPAPVALAGQLDPVRVEAFVDGAVLSAMRRDHIAGVGVAIVDRHGTVLAKGYGLAAPGRPATADTLFRVGSISKTGVWIALMQLVEQGKLSLDDPINAHLSPRLRIPDEGFREPIRIRNLMSHNAGFEDSGLGHIFPLDPHQLLNQETYLATYRVHRVRPPEQIAVYSNYGAGLAGMIVAHETGLDWPTYAERYILRPLGMLSSTYRDPYSPAIAQARHLPAPMSQDLAARVTQGWRWQHGQLVPAPYEYVSHNASAGALSMSASDAARYMQALLDPDVMARARVLRAQTARILRQPLFANYPGFGALRHGFLTYELGDGRWAYGHDGGLLWHVSNLMVSPQLGVGVFISVNTPTGSDLIDSLSRTFFEEFFPSPPHPQAPRPADAKAAAQRYAGIYRPLRRAYFRTEAALESLQTAKLSATADGDLVGGLFGSAQTRLRPVGQGLYRVVGGTGYVAFKEVGGRMLAFDPQGVNPLERVSFFASLDWLILIFAAGLIAAVAGVAAGARRLALRGTTRPALVLDGLCLFWLIALVVTMVAIGSIVSDTKAILSHYPPAVLPLACWLLLIAALGTLIALVQFLFVFRRNSGNALSWIRAAIVLVILSALSLTLWQHGFLGFSGWK